MRELVQSQLMPGTCVSWKRSEHNRQIQPEIFNVEYVPDS